MDEVQKLNNSECYTPSLEPIRIDFLLHDLQKILEDVPLAVRARMWYMHDGAPAHFSRAVRDVLNIMTDGKVEEDPLHGLHAPQI
jgi:hypothetical protein